MATKVYVFFGPDSAFDELVSSKTKEDDYTVGYLEAIRVYNTKVRATQFVTPGAFEDMPEKVDNCVVKSTSAPFLATWFRASPALSSRHSRWTGCLSRTRQAAP